MKSNRPNAVLDIIRRADETRVSDREALLLDQLVDFALVELDLVWSGRRPAGLNVAAAPRSPHRPRTKPARDDLALHTAPNSESNGRLWPRRRLKVCRRHAVDEGPPMRVELDHVKAEVEPEILMPNAVFLLHSSSQPACQWACHLRLSGDRLDRCDWQRGPFA
eukprot:CAMPEP_0183364146 /NCGR_PEP_ID=MMETSP0164_2-20130417/78687_1 /TAXON_ID=221442 /ORGANISM="Coccolithus pelagicus ssp braarudi, Strain PLY182g" /LENGTH=163 /DNA_ID=CAMNT_0025539387 /DNA_START=600 /DNA_END=1091 /DNA_ORIENTATION=-